MNTFENILVGLLQGTEATVPIFCPFPRGDTDSQRQRDDSGFDSVLRFAPAVPNVSAVGRLKIVFCTTCKGRAQHVTQTLPRNLAANDGFRDCIFVLLDYSSPDHLSSYLAQHHAADIRSGRLVVYSYPNAGSFRMAHAKNMAHRLGMMEGGDVLVNLDADNFTGPGFAAWVARQLRYRNDAFLWSRMIRGELSRGISGRIAVTRQAFLKAGGYDEKYETWSPDDKDFNARLRRLGYDGVEIDPQFLLALNHNDKMRFCEYKHAATAMGEDEFELHSDVSVVNVGRVGLGTVYRNFGDEPIEIKPLPTRIFGIGMHKTATTSLHHALQILGIDTAHWNDAHWAKRIFEEMTTVGRSPTLERHYALSDLPITILYEQLDRAYPGSKFILTTRSEQSWLNSVRKHWSHEHNQWRADWSKDPFTHRIHKEVYGQKGFEAEIMLARFRRHNAEVREYFRDRPNDLLVMDMDRGHGWPELCGFLGCPIPAEAYPVRNGSPG